METADQSQVEVPVTPEVAPIVLTPTFKVKVYDLHNAFFKEYITKSMDEAINLYKELTAQARNTEPRPFVYLDDAHWLSVIKYSGGLVRQVWVSDAQDKVRGHNGGMRKREAARTPVTDLPPMIVPQPRPAAVPGQGSVAPVQATTEDVPF